MDTHIIIIVVVMIIIIIIIIIITVLSTPQNLLVRHAAKKEKIVLFDKIVHEKIFNSKKHLEKSIFVIFSYHLFS